MSKPLTIQYTGKYANHLLREKEREIERLGNELQVQIEDNIRLNEYIEAQDNKLQQKENIIKEVREYVESHKKMTQGSFNGKEWIEQYFELVCNPKELLEILDKEKI